MSIHYVIILNDVLSLVKVKPFYLLLCSLSFRKLFDSLLASRRQPFSLSIMVLIRSPPKTRIKSSSQLYKKLSHTRRLAFQSVHVTDCLYGVTHVVQNPKQTIHQAFDFIQDNIRTTTCDVCCKSYRSLCPALATMTASFVILSIENLMWNICFFSRFPSNSFFSIDAVPIKTGCPLVCSILTSLIIAFEFSCFCFVYTISKDHLWRLVC